MLTFLHNKLQGIAVWPVVAILIFAFLACSFIFEWRQEALGYQAKILDARFGYSPLDVVALFEQLGESGRKLYAITEISLDLIFPFIYGLLFAAFIIRLYSRKSARWLVLIPVLAVIADLLENSMIAYLAWGFNGQESKLVWIAATFTRIKLICFLASVLLLPIGGISGFRNHNTDQRNN